MLYDLPGLTYTDRGHRYTLQGQTLLSVTSMLDRFREPFDANEQAKLSAKKLGMTVPAVLAMWAEKRQAGTALHAAAHAFAETGQSPQGVYAEALVSWWRARKPEAFACEPPLAWPEGGIAGTPDLICAIGSEAGIVDYKTNSEIWIAQEWRPRRGRQKEPRRMFPPVDHLMDDVWTGHALQLTTYRRMAETYDGTPRLSFQMVVHLRPDGTFREYPKPYLKSAVEAMVEAIRTGDTT